MREIKERDRPFSTFSIFSQSTIKMRNQITKVITQATTRTATTRPGPGPAAANNYGGFIIHMAKSIFYSREHFPKILAMIMVTGTATGYFTMDYIHHSRIKVN